MEQPGITRRSVIRLAGLGTAAIALGGVAGASPFLSTTVDAANRTVGTKAAAPAAGVTFALATFTPLLGKAFRVKADGTTHTIVLDAVVARPGTAPGESFSLLFNGDIPAFTQGTYQVQQASLGQFAMFVAPVNQPTHRQRYEAAVNTRGGA
jgi:hypothetical protein